MERSSSLPSPMLSLSPSVGGATPPRPSSHDPGPATDAGVHVGFASSPDVSAALDVGEMHASTSFLAPGHDLCFLAEDTPGAASPSLFGDSPAWVQPGGYSIRHSMPAPPARGAHAGQHWSLVDGEVSFAQPPAPGPLVTQSIQFPRHVVAPNSIAAEITPVLRAAELRRAALESSLDGSLQPRPESTSTRGHWDAPRAGLPLVHKPASPATPSKETASGPPHEAATANDKATEALRDQLEEMEARCEASRQREAQTAASLSAAEATLEESKQSAKRQEMKLRSTEDDLKIALERLSMAEELLSRKSQELEESQANLQIAESSLDEKSVRLQDVASDANRELEDGKFREEIMHKQLKEAKESAADANQRLQDAQRRVEALESNEGQLHEQIDKQRSLISLLSARLTDAEMECSATKEAMLDAANAKDGLTQAVARDRSELEGTRSENRSLRRSIELQENTIIGLQAEIRRCKDECEQLQRRNIFLEGQTQALAGRGSPVHLDIPDRRPPSRAGPGPAPVPRELDPQLQEQSRHPPEPERSRDMGLRSSVQSLQRPQKLNTDQQELLEYMMSKVRAATQGSGTFNMNNPPGLDSQERSLFKYLVSLAQGGNSRPASPSAGQPSVSYHDRAAAIDSSHRSASAFPNADVQRPTGPQPPSGNRPPPFATGYGTSDEMQRRHPEPQGAPVDSYKRQDYVNALPFGTEETLQESISNTHQIESRLLELNKEKTQLIAEASRVPANGGKTIAARERSSWVESRLDTIQKGISKCKLDLKRLGVR